MIESVGDNQAARSLQERGLMVVSLAEKRKLDWRNILPGLSNTVSDREVATFTRLLGTMLSTGLPLVDALSNLVSQVRSSYFQEVIRSVQNDVQSGISLSAAVGRFPQVFNGLYVSLVRAGEASGKVGETLERLADSLEGDLDFKAKISGALVYPAIIVMAMTGIAIFMMTTIIPTIAEVYKEFNANLPLPTQVLITISTVIRSYSLLFILFLGLMYFFYRTLRKNPVSDFLINNALYKIPVFGSLNEDVALAILNRVLSTLLSSGVAIIESLKIVAETMKNDRFRAGIAAAATGVEKGLPFSVMIRRDQSFPLMMSQLCAIGEQTGTLDQSLGRVANFFQDSAERRVKVVTTAMEPLILILMGLMVGGLAIAVLLPMFNLVNVIK